LGRVDGLLEDGLGRLGGNLFDLHAAGLRGHEDQFTFRPVEDNAEIKLSVDGSGLLDQQPLDFLPPRAGLARDQRHAENVFGVEFGLLARVGQLDAAALAAASGVNLRLDDDARGALGKELAGHCIGLFESVGHFAPGHGYAVLCQDFLRLILVNLHCR
jgi:hypothetical protein